ISYHDGLMVTTPGRIILNEAVRATMAEYFDSEEEYPLPFVNVTTDKNVMAAMITAAFQNGGAAVTVGLADALKDLGFEYATRSGVTVSASDIVIPAEKEAILAEA